MKIRFRIEDDEGNVILLGHETDLKQLSVNDVQIIRDRTVNVADTSQRLSSNGVSANTFAGQRYGGWLHDESLLGQPTDNNDDD